MSADSDLVERIRRCELSALGEAYELHSVNLHGLAARLCGGDNADALVRDVFLALWREPERYDEARGTLGEHLTRSAHAHARRRGLVTDDDRVTALAARLGAEAWAELSKLPTPLRDAIALASFAGWSYGELAAILARLDDAVRRDLDAGLEHLRVLVAGPRFDPRRPRADAEAPAGNVTPRDVLVSASFGRRAENALADDVALDLGGATLDGVGPAAQEELPG